MHKGKPNRHEKVAQILLSGKPIHPDTIKQRMSEIGMEHLSYRLATNIYNIRKDGGIIRVTKDGRNVTGYQLVNYQEFNETGRYVGRTIKVPTGEIKVMEEV